MAPAFVRATPLSGSTAVSGSTAALTVTLPTAATAGNALIVQIGLNASSNASVTALTDNAGNTYTQRVDGFQTSSNTRITTWDCLNLAANVTTLTVTTGATSVGIRLYADEWSGMAGYGYDTGSALGAAASTTPTAPAVTASVGELLYTAINYPSVTFTATQSNTAATTRGPVSASAGRVYITDGTAATAASYATPWTLTGSSASGQSIVGYTSATVRSDTAALGGTGTLGSAGAILVSGDAAFNGAGSLTAVGQNPNPVAAAAFNGAGTLTASPQGNITSTVALGGAGTLGAVGAIVGRGTATFTGTGVLTGTGAVVGQGPAALGGIGFLNAATRPATTDTAALNGTGTLGATTSVALHGTAAFNGGGTLNAAGAATHRGTATFTSDGTFTVTLTLPQLRDLATLNGEGTLEALGVKREPRRPRDITITAVTEPETAWLTTEPGAAWETTDPTTAVATTEPTIGWPTTEPTLRAWIIGEPDTAWDIGEPAAAMTTTEPHL